MIQMRFIISATEGGDESPIMISKAAVWEFLPQIGHKFWFGCGEMPTVTGVVHYPKEWRGLGPAVDVEMQASRLALIELLSRKEEGWKDDS